MAPKHSIYDTDQHFVIDPITRAITNQTPSKTKLMQYDHNSERFTFEMPRLVEGHEMSKCSKIEIHYLNIDASTKETNADVYIVDDTQVSPDGEDVVIFSWQIKASATKYAGLLNFTIHFTCLTDTTIDYAWGTDIFKGISVGESIYNSETMLENYTDVLEAWKRDIEKAFYTKEEADAKYALKSDLIAIQEEINGVEVELQMVNEGGVA